MICTVTNTSDCISVTKVMLNGGKGIKQMKNRVAHLLKNAGKAPFQGCSGIIYLYSEGKTPNSFLKHLVK